MARFRWRELCTEDSFQQLVVAIEATRAFSAASASLKIMASAVCRWSELCGGAPA
jgi:hypothetical protein